MKNMKVVIWLNVFFVITLLGACNLQMGDVKIRNIKNMKITGVELLYEKSTLRIAGEKIKFGLQVTTTDGEKYSTKGWGKGTLRWTNFKINVVGGSQWFDKITIDKNLPYSTKQILVNVKDSKKKGIDTTFVIPLNQITGIDLVALNSFPKAPGRYADMAVRYKYDCGINTMETKFFKRKNRFKDFDIYVDGGYFGNPRFNITHNIFDIIDHQVGMVAVFKHDKSIRDTFEIGLDYIDNYSQSYYGMMGESGFDGYDGYDGSDASCYSCSGEPGQNGARGGDGYMGYSGPNVNVYVDAYFDEILNTSLLKIQVDDNRHESQYYLVNPEGGYLNIYSHGGSGGSGGNGGNGGDGGDGGEGEQRSMEVEEHVTKTDTAGNEYKVVEKKTIYVYTAGGCGGRGGYGGDGGNGGHGGHGGDISVYFSSKAQPFISQIIAHSVGGSAGFGGIGGNSGSGGSGGKGDPNGNSGSSGYSGMRGSSGFSGYSGEVAYVQTNVDIW